MIDIRTMQLGFSRGSPAAVRGERRRRAAVTTKSSIKGMQLVGVGACAPDTVLSNDDLAKMVDTNDEWITTRTGIRRRHVLGKGETLSSLAKVACERALEMAKVQATDIDLILFATSSPDDLFGGAGQVRRCVLGWRFPKK